MSYALVMNNAVQSEGGLPASARRLDTQQWVMGLPAATVALQQACGYYVVTDVAQPADTPTATYDRSVTLVAGVPTVTWTQRAKTPAEVAGATAQTNQSTIVTNLAADLAAMQTIIDTANTAIVVTTLAQAQQAARDALQRDKDIARMLRRLGRLASNTLDGAT